VTVVCRTLAVSIVYVATHYQKNIVMPM